MVETLAGELTRLVDRTATTLSTIDTETARVKPGPDQWSIAEILGHLVDSAANNHQRFVRGQEVDPLVLPAYTQNHWVECQGYNATPWPDLVALWRLYNRHLASVIARIRPEALPVTCHIGDYDPVTLEFIVEDYLVHMKHHLAQIWRRIPS
jgi:hypothetical protein